MGTFLLNESANSNEKKSKKFCKKFMDSFNVGGLFVISFSNKTHNILLTLQQLRRDFFKVRERECVNNKILTTKKDKKE